MNALLIACAALLLLVAVAGLSLPALTRAVRGPGHHRRPARLTLFRAPAPTPAQAPRPADPPRSEARGAVRAGATQAPAPCRRAAGTVQAQDAGTVAAPDDAPAAAPPSARQLPQPRSPGLGQPPAIQLPDGMIAAWENGRYRIRAGELPKIRPYLTAWWEYRDQPAQVVA